MTRLALLVLVLALPGLATAQEPTPPRPAPPDGEQRREEPRRGPPWSNPDFSRQAVEFLTRELDLDAGQQEKAKAIMEGSIRDAMKKAAELMMGENGPDFTKMRDVMEEVRVDVAKKLNDILSPDQKREFEALVDQFDQRAQSWEQQRRAMQTPSQMFDPPPISRRVLLAKAERSLFLGPDETAVVMGYVTKVIDLRIALDEGRKTRRQDLMSAIEGGAKEAEVRQRLDRMHEAEQFQTLELAAAQEQLKELLSVEQEVRFVAMGILD